VIRLTIIQVTDTAFKLFLIVLSIYLNSLLTNLSLTNLSDSLLCGIKLFVKAYQNILQALKHYKISGYSEFRNKKEFALTS